MKEKCFRIIVKGKVQGVFFRKYARIKAVSLGITGFVKNWSGDAVYMEACGEKKALDEFVAWCHNGPQNAEVKNVEVIEIPFKKFSEFKIEYD